MAGTDHRRIGASLPGPQPEFVLVRPQLGENIGTSARAMLNCCFDRMRIVAPRDGWPQQSAVNAASGANTVLERATIYPDIGNAIADCRTVYATTARPRGMEMPVLTPREAAADILRRGEAGETVAILFGAERTGLENEEIARAQYVITAPLNPAFASLNLAQAVLLVAMELHLATAAAWPLEETPPASQGDVDRLITHLEQELQAADFYPVPEKKPRMVRNLRAFFARARPTEQEVRTWHGMITALSGRRLDGTHRGSRRATERLSAARGADLPPDGAG